MQLLAGTLRWAVETLDRCAWLAVACTCLLENFADTPPPGKEGTAQVVAPALQFSKMLARGCTHQTASVSRRCLAARPALHAVRPAPVQQRRHARFVARVAEVYQYL